MESRLSKKYQSEIVPTLIKEFGFSSKMQVPKLKKIVLNCGVGETTVNGKAMQFVEYGLAAITGQKPLVTKSKKAISNFKIREGLPIGCMVTLRGQRMYSFLDRLISVALPRVRDFRGVPKRGFDGRGNYTMGIKEQIVFPEVVMERLDRVRGMDVTFVTSADNDEQARALLSHLGMPFRK
ncbi:MAG TPA: 50S ribosomal protein L5 [Oligoflexia bacterium]|nr:50S ribosomal protein L5 [Oligoflexia bacterium]HMP26486.1 50S ribosomal protein L5 [Oligoflexia bacterium]